MWLLDDMNHHLFSSNINMKNFLGANAEHNMDLCDVLKVKLEMIIPQSIVWSNVCMHYCQKYQFFLILSA